MTTPAAPPTVEGLMTLVREYGQLRESAGGSAAVFERVAARRERDEADDVEEGIHAYASRLCAPAALTDDQIKAAIIAHFTKPGDDPDEWHVDGLSMLWFRSVGLPYARAVLAAQKGASNA